MIIKLSDGAFYELTKREYTQFIVEVMVHFESEQKLTMNFVKDTRYEAAKLLLDTVARNPAMSEQQKDEYMKLSLDLLDQYNRSLQAKGEGGVTIETPKH